MHINKAQETPQRGEHWTETSLYFLIMGSCSEEEAIL